MLIVVGLIMIAVINETMGISFILPAAQCDLNLTTEDKGRLSSMTFIGEFDQIVGKELNFKFEDL